MSTNITKLNAYVVTRKYTSPLNLTKLNAYVIVRPRQTPLNLVKLNAYIIVREKVEPPKPSFRANPIITVVRT